MLSSEVKEGHIYESDSFAEDRQIVRIVKERGTIRPDRIYHNVYYILRGVDDNLILNSGQYLCSMATFQRWAKRDVTEDYQRKSARVV